MSQELFFNGNKYRLIKAGRDGEKIRQRYADVPEGSTIVCTIKGQPAILFNGEFYKVVERLTPGSGGIWNRVNSKVTGRN